MLAMVALPFYLQQACGYNDVETGLLLTAWPAVIMVVAPAAGLLVERIHAGLLGGTGLTMMAAGLFLLAFLPEHPTDFDIIWRLVLCGAGFGLFQSPNNSILIASAPPERSGSASGMLATARLIGQTTGAALMALLFHIVPGHSTHTALLLAGGFAVTAPSSASPASRCRSPKGSPEENDHETPYPDTAPARSAPCRSSGIRHRGIHPPALTCTAATPWASSLRRANCR